MGKLRILSIDGGGLRGIVPLTIIKYIELKSGKKIHELFDVISGTSTGGLLACALTVPENKSSLKKTRKYSLDTIEEIYLDKGKVIFPRPYKLMAPLYWLWSKAYPRYSSANIEHILSEYLRGFYLKDCIIPIFITTYDVHSLRPVYFTTRESIEDGKNILLTDVCRATSAAPTYFSTHNLSYGNNNLYCIDGGIFMNNPSMGALVEVLSNPNYKYYNITPGLNIENIHMLSLGTGYSSKILNGKKTKRWGEVQWAKPAIDISLNSGSDVVNQQVSTMFNAVKCSSNYLRQNIYINEEYAEMSDSRADTLGYLKRTVKEQIINEENNRKRLDNFIKNLQL